MYTASAAAISSFADIVYIAISRHFKLYSSIIFNIYCNLRRQKTRGDCRQCMRKFWMVQKSEEIGQKDESPRQVIGNHHHIEDVSYGS